MSKKKGKKGPKSKGTLEDRLRALSAKTGRSFETYRLIDEALTVAVRGNGRRTADGGRAATAEDLCRGLLFLSVQCFGQLAWAVLEHHGLVTTDAIGVVVYEMIGDGTLSQESGDRREDFHAIFDFSQAVKDEMADDFARIGWA